MIRKAAKKDIPKIMDLLSQVCLVHHNGRPDIFKVGTKYSVEELGEILGDEKRPILVSTDENDDVMGYCFCILQQHVNNSVMTDIRTLYIDDLCVDETKRGQHIGSMLYEYVREQAKQMGCYHVTLNVWCLNESAMNFYKKCGLSPLKITMEQIL